MAAGPQNRRTMDNAVTNRPNRKKSEKRIIPARPAATSDLLSPHFIGSPSVLSNRRPFWEGEAPGRAFPRLLRRGPNGRWKGVSATVHPVFKPWVSGIWNLRLQIPAPGATGGAGVSSFTPWRIREGEAPAEPLPHDS